VTSPSQYLAVKEALAAQPKDARFPNFKAAERTTGVDRNIVAKLWTRGLRATAKTEALPPLAADYAPPTPIPEPGPRTDVTPKAPLTDLIGGSPVAPVAAAAPDAGPLTADASAALAAELKLISSGRHATAGLIATATALLSIVHRGAPGLADALTALMATEPARAAALLETIARAVESSLRSADRLAALSRLAAGLPSQITEHRTAEVAAPITDAEIERRVALVMGAVERRAAELQAPAAPVLVEAEVVAAATAGGTP
jgi:hypothetical protein